MSTVLITGCSSGFGLATAKLFLQKGWDVIATMRTSDPTLLPDSSKLIILPLDITSAESIANVVKEVGAIDVLVNNAGFGVNADRIVTHPAKVKLPHPCQWLARNVGGYRLLQLSTF